MCNVFFKRELNNYNGASGYQCLLIPTNQITSIKYSENSPQYLSIHIEALMMMMMMQQGEIRLKDIIKFLLMRSLQFLDMKKYTDMHLQHNIIVLSLNTINHEYLTIDIDCLKLFPSLQYKYET